MLLVYDALRLKNTIQIIGLCLFNNALLIYAAVQMTQINDAVQQLGPLIKSQLWGEVKPFLIAIPCVIALGTVAMSFVARKLYDEFAWTIYKHISADLRMKKRYLTYQVCICPSSLPIKLMQHTDIYCSPEVRLLLFHRLHRPIYSHSCCCRYEGRRICVDDCRHSCHHSHSHHGWLYHAKGEHDWNDCHHCKTFVDL